jgi:hypothetical protein
VKNHIGRLAACGIAVWVASACAQASALEVKVVSSAPQLVTGADALIQVTGLTGLPHVTLRGRDVAVDLETNAQNPGVWLGLVHGLIDGANDVTVTSGHDTATITVINHPINATLIAGPQASPFLCELDSLGLTPTNTTHLDPLNADCAVAPKVAYYYRNTAGKWLPFDVTKARPTDIDKGANGQPMIIRQETGVINRAAYVISVPHDPAAGPAPTPTDRGSLWNGKLMYSFGPGAKPDGHHQGRNMGGLAASTQFVGSSNGSLYWYIDHGYAIASASLNAFGTTTDAVVSGETAYKVKEQFIKEYGQPLFTVGDGQSGGSMQQQTINNAYPGVLDGIVPALSFSDGMTFFQPLADCALLANVFKTGNWTRDQMNAVSGTYWGYCVSNGPRYQAQNPGNCDAAVLMMEMTNPAIKPNSIRCTFQDDLSEVFGKDPSTGLGRSPWDNVGLQYGLKALNDGVINFDRFLDINKRIGGYDINGNVVAQREVADPNALRAAYATGQVDEYNGGNASVPIVSIRYNLDADPWNRGDANVDVHTRFHSVITDARLQKYNGTDGNYVQMLAATTGPGYGPDPSTVGSPYNLEASEAATKLDQWMTAIANDKSNLPQAQKVIADKPKDFVNACWTVDGKNQSDWSKGPQGTVQKVTDWNQCQQTFPTFTDPRVAAGGPLTDDVLKCQLKPVDAKDYKAAATADQLAQLKAVFPDGVCDYSKPGVGQDAKLTEWAVFTDRGKWAGL